MSAEPPRFITWGLGFSEATFRKIGDRWSAEVYVNGIRKSVAWLRCIVFDWIMRILGRLCDLETHGGLLSIR